MSDISFQSIGIAGHAYIKQHDQYIGSVLDQPAEGTLFVHIHQPSIDAFPVGSTIDLYAQAMPRSASREMDTVAIRSLVEFYISEWAIARAERAAEERMDAGPDDVPAPHTKEFRERFANIADWLDKA